MCHHHVPPACRDSRGLLLHCPQGHPGSSLSKAWVPLSDKLDPHPSPKVLLPQQHQSPVLAFVDPHALLPPSPHHHISTETPWAPRIMPSHTHRLPAGVSSHPVPDAGTFFLWMISGCFWPSFGHLSSHYLKPHLCSCPGCPLTSLLHPCHQQPC